MKHQVGVKKFNIHVSEDSTPAEEMFVSNMTLIRIIRLFGLFFAGGALAVVFQYFDGLYSKTLFLLAILLTGLGSIIFWINDLKRR